MRALGEQRDEHHEIRQGKEPVVRLGAGDFSGAGDEAEVARFGEIVEVLHADSGEAGDLRIGEDFLTRLYGDHGLAPEPNSSGPICDPTATFSNPSSATNSRIVSAALLHPAAASTI